MGYVGLPIAVSFSRHVDVIGFDINSEKVRNLKAGQDVTGEVEEGSLKECRVCFTADEEKLSEADFFIIAVPTPVDEDKNPDLTPLTSASAMLGRHLKQGDVVVYESTVYPGLTEEVCVPILEEQSGLVYKKEFKVGYSPERINPGDKVHRLETIVKIVSGCDEETKELIASVYELVVEAGIFRAESIRVAEAAKVIENSQRDINIAFMNELSIIFHKMGIDTKAVLEAAKTKWNFLDFKPGLVGGHCIGIDPYYLTYQAQKLGYHSEVILSGRRINDNMGQYIARCIVKKLIEADACVKGAVVGIFGFTFKENCPDVRNTRVIDIVKELEEYQVQTVLVDSKADCHMAKLLYGVEVIKTEQVRAHSLDAIVLAVSHQEFYSWTPEDWDFYYKEEISCKLIADIKGIYNKREYEEKGYSYWRL
ncbi:MAG: nucleotide sugar dehydrogenase [Lachnospiraceae bacterium]|nr:nucleotide sugar dehydrogenase [Lachnospiraceae bacterium]